MSSVMNELSLETIVMEWFEHLDFSILSGATIAPGELEAERTNFDQVVLEPRLRNALVRLNPHIPAEALDEAYRKIIRPDAPTLVANNRFVHRQLIDGVSVEYQREDGSIAGDMARVIDFDDPSNNDWLVVNQFTIKENKHTRRPDIVVFVNGLPLAVIELKNPADENATIWSAFNQIQTYKQQIPTLFAYNEACIISDGIEARIGTMTANTEWFMPWRTIDGETLADKLIPQLQVMIEGVFEKRRFLDMVRYFITYEDLGDGTVIKKMAGYHQFHAVNKALQETVKASRAEGDRKVGVVWHTQGSGKSLSMAFYAGRVILEPAMENPTLVILTDRNDLDDQLFGTFASCKELLRQAPMQANDRNHLRELLDVASGGVIFTTIQKFFPEDEEIDHPLLSNRHNIVVIADEAHRSQYGLKAKTSIQTGKTSYGFAKYCRDALPKASFIGFTGTPIELTDKNTQKVFGGYISIYDIQQAVDDGATVPIYYESRLAMIDLDEAEKPKIDEAVEEATEGEELARVEKTKTKWAAIEALVGIEKRLKLIAQDIVSHFEKRVDAMDGKAMIVCMSRRICVDLYEQIKKIRPDWHHEEDLKGKMKIIMTGSASDPESYQPHIRSKKQREKMAERFKNAKDSFQIVFVRDMWLTGFDAPCLHTMYIDKPMQGHSLMQAIARVNRVFKDKPGGLVVDYIGFADQLKIAMKTYTESGGKGEGYKEQEKAAVPIMQEKYEICCNMFHGFDWSKWKTGTSQDKLNILPAAQEHILQQDDGKKRFNQAVKELSHAFALAVPHKKAIEIRDDVGFFQAVRAVLVKNTTDQKKTNEDLNHAIRQIVDNAIAPKGIIDIFESAGLKKPDISILSDEFLDEIRALPHKNLAIEMLRKLLNDEIKTRSQRSIVQARLFSEMLEKSIKRYQNKTIQTAEVIEELMTLAKQMKDADRKGEELGLNKDEIAFYEALEVNDSAVQVLGDETLKIIANELVKAVKNSVTIDWSVRENVRAKIRVIVKRILKKYGYPPDKQEKATQTVLEQAELLSEEWAA